MISPSINKQEWLEARAKCITATDAAAILNLHPFKTPRLVYLEKTGQLQEQEETEAMFLGTELEPYIASMYCKRNDLVLGTDVVPTGFIVAPDNPRRGATPDYLNVKTGDLIECKYAGPNAARNFGQEESDEIPTHYLIQCQYQMRVTGKKRCILVLFTAFGKLKTYTIDRDDELIRRMNFKVDMFDGEYLLAKNPPPLSGHEPDTELLKRQFPEDDGATITASYDLEETIARLGAKTQELREVELDVEECKNRIREFMGEASVMESVMGRFSWKCNKPGVKTDWKVCFDGLRAYSSIMLADQPDLHQLFVNESVRLVDAATETRPGARVLRTPFRSERS